MLEEFYAEKKPIGMQLRNKQKALEYSVLHRWFIFVKRTVLDDLPGEEKESVFSLKRLYYSIKRKALSLRKVRK